MHITKFTQSCVKIEKDGHPIMVDVGTLTSADFSMEMFGRVDAVVFTHSHQDHLDVEVAKKFLAAGVPIYGNAEVAAAIDDDRVEIFEDDEELVIVGFKFKAFHMEHCLMVNGSSSVKNTGFLVDDRLLLPGDSVDAPAKLKADVVAVPVFGPDISLHDAYRLLEAVQAKIAIPVHYDIAKLNPAVFEMMGGQYLPNLQIKILQNADSIDI